MPILISVYIQKEDFIMKKKLSFPKNKIRILLLEDIHEITRKRLEEAGYTVSEIKRSLSPDELTKEISDVHMLGVRSKTKITEGHLEQGRRLLAIGCFGVGTNQVALDRATTLGIPVFNAPYGNTRSVAELTLGYVIMLARRATDKNTKMHQGRWDKSATGAMEVRGKTIGIVGFGHIGQQIGVLAEAIGMDVLFFDSIQKLPLGNAHQVDTLAELLEKADFVSLHVPGQLRGKTLVGKKELELMKQGSYLLNLSRGDLVDLQALKDALLSQHLGGAAFDVFSSEPKTNDEPFQTELAGIENVILTPHIGGSTEEAQYNIGVEVSAAFVKFIDAGSTIGAVNFPQVNLSSFPESHRILNIHKNVPGVLSEVNKIISDLGANIDSQYLNTYRDIGYLIMDINKNLSEEVKEKIGSLPTSIKTRMLY